MYSIFSVVVAYPWCDRTATTLNVFRASVYACWHRLGVHKRIRWSSSVGGGSFWVLRVLFVSAVWRGSACADMSFSTSKIFESGQGFQPRTKNRFETLHGTWPSIVAHPKSIRDSRPFCTMTSCFPGLAEQGYIMSCVPNADRFHVEDNFPELRVVVARKCCFGDRRPHVRHCNICVRRPQQSGGPREALTV